MIRTDYKMVRINMQYAVSGLPRDYLISALEKHFGCLIRDFFTSEEYWLSVSSIINFLIGDSCIGDRFSSYTASGINKRGKMLV